MYNTHKHAQYINFFDTHKLWILEERESKYFGWAALITNGTRESKVYIGNAVSINPIAINDIITSIIISDAPQGSKIKKHLKKKAFSSENMTPLALCYVVAKFYGVEALATLFCKPSFLTQLNYKEQLELYYLVNNAQQVVLLYENNKDKVFTLQCYERIYDAYTRLGQLKFAEGVFLEADELYAPLKNVISAEINPNAINNKLERQYWFAKGDFVRAFHAYKRQQLSQVLYVSFEDKYTQELEDIINAKSPLVLASWGLGDEIRFSRLYNLLTKLNPSITISCEPRLYELLSLRFPEVKFISTGRTYRVTENDSEAYNKLPHDKLHHLMDNALLYELEQFDKVTIVTDLTSQLFDDYLQNRKTIDVRHPSSVLSSSFIDEVKKIREKNKTIIGLSWRSSIETIVRNEHCFQLQELEPLFKLENVAFVILQYGDYSKEVERIKTNYNVDTSLLNDFSGVYDVMQHLDIIVSTGSTVLELAGLSGIKTFALTNVPHFKSRVQKDNHDLWFPSIEYIDDMTHLNKVELVDKIAKKIEALDGCF